MRVKEKTMENETIIIFWWFSRASFMARNCSVSFWRKIHQIILVLIRQGRASIAQQRVGWVLSFKRAQRSSNRWDFLSHSLTLPAMLWIHIHWPRFSLRYFKALTFVSCTDLLGICFLSSTRELLTISRESFDCFVSSCSDVFFNHSSFLHNFLYGEPVTQSFKLFKFPYKVVSVSSTEKLV